MILADQYYQALEHYRNAGEALVELKAECQAEGVGFKALIEGEVHFAYRRAAHLMKLAREWPMSWGQYTALRCRCVRYTGHDNFKALVESDVYVTYQRQKANC